MSLGKFTRATILLALAIASVFLKNLSVYVTGPIVNCVLVICALYCGLGYAAAISVIVPLLSWLITASPIISAMPLIAPCIMLGNLLLALFVWLFCRKADSFKRLTLGLAVGCAAKAAFMGITISMLILTLMGPASRLPQKALDAAKISFSVTQLVTALMGCILVPPIKRALDKAKQ